MIGTGVNSFNDLPLLGYYDTDLVSITKPVAGTGCPDESTFTVDRKISLKDPGGTRTATPDPGAPLGRAHGRVWLTNQWVKRPGGEFAGWRTWNWAVVPGP